MSPEELQGLQLIMESEREQWDRFLGCLDAGSREWAKETRRLEAELQQHLQRAWAASDSNEADAGARWVRDHVIELAHRACTLRAMYRYWLERGCPALGRAERVVLAWGRPEPGLRLMVSQRADEVRRHIAAMGRALEVGCLGRAQDGSPRHPLMLAYDTAFERVVVE